MILIVYQKRMDMVLKGRLVAGQAAFSSYHGTTLKGGGRGNAPAIAAKRWHC